MLSARSACRGTSRDVAELFEGSGSNRAEVATLAVLDWTPGAATRAIRVRVADAPEARSPTCQVPVVGSYEPGPGSVPTKASPAGRASTTASAVTASGPRFEAVTTRRTVSPTFGLVASKDEVRATSDCNGRTCTAARLSPGLGSNWSAWRIVAATLEAEGERTVATRVSVVVAPPASEGTDHVPVAGSNEPAPGVESTRAKPAGTGTS